METGLEDSDGHVGSNFSGNPASYWPESDSKHSDGGLASGRFPFFGSPRLSSDERKFREFFGIFLVLDRSRNKPPQKYLIDNLAEQYGHKVLRLPPYHCVFNPIEHVWGLTKNYYNKHIGRDGTTATSCLNMWDEALTTVTPEIWKNCIRHTEDEIPKWYAREHLFDRQEILPIVINVDDDDDSDFDFTSLSE
ncbi:hypothetical protein D910_05429 [Dendroctonus ponderosae]